MIIVVGEALIDMIEGPDLRYDAQPGGAPANVAASVAGYGSACSLFARVSTDLLGDRLVSHLSGFGVDMSRAIRSDHPTALALATLQDDGAAAYSLYTSEAPDWRWLHGELTSVVEAEPAVVLFGSLSASIMPGSAEVTRCMRELSARADSTIAYDANIRSSLVSDRATEVGRVASQAAAADILKFSDEDLACLHPDLGWEEAARGYLTVPEQIMIVTHGPGGSDVLRTGAPVLHVPAHTVEQVVDTVGAGDTFLATILHLLVRDGLTSHGTRLRDAPISDEELRRIVEIASWAAAMTCQRRGASAPSFHELAEFEHVRSTL